jgi:hypothetical protein
MFTEPFGADAPQPVKLICAQFSFHGISGIYFSADVPVAVLVELQYEVQLLISSKSVPPTATLNGVEANPLTARPWVAMGDGRGRRGGAHDQGDDRRKRFH